MSQIKIDPVWLDAEIFNLTNLLFECEENSRAQFFLLGMGKTNDAMIKFNDSFLNLDRALAVLIQSTIELLKNAKDGYVNADENTAGLMKQLQEEVFPK